MLDSSTHLLNWDCISSQHQLICPNRFTPKHQKYPPQRRFSATPPSEQVMQCSQRPRRLGMPDGRIPTAELQAIEEAGPPSANVSKLFPRRRNAPPTTNKPRGGETSSNGDAPPSAYNPQPRGTCFPWWHMSRSSHEPLTSSRRRRPPRPPPSMLDARTLNKLVGKILDIATRRRAPPCR